MAQRSAMRAPLRSSTSCVSEACTSRESAASKDDYYDVLIHHLSAKTGWQNGPRHLRFVPRHAACFPTRFPLSKCLAPVIIRLLPEEAMKEANPGAGCFIPFLLSELHGPL